MINQPCYWSSATGHLFWCFSLLLFPFNKTWDTTLVWLCFIYLPLPWRPFSHLICGLLKNPWVLRNVQSRVHICVIFFFFLIYLIYLFLLKDVGKNERNANQEMMCLFVCFCERFSFHSLRFKMTKHFWSNRNGSDQRITKDKEGNEKIQGKVFKDHKTDSLLIWTIYVVIKTLAQW